MLSMCLNIAHVSVKFDISDTYISGIIGINVTKENNYGLM